jgi:hypothetical protein
MHQRPGAIPTQYRLLSDATGVVNKLWKEITKVYILWGVLVRLSRPVATSF